MPTTAPTPEEILFAHKDIGRDIAATPAGSIHETTVKLGLLIQRDPTIRGIVDRMVDGYIVLSRSPLDTETLRGLVHGAMMSGLNMGLRIGEARASKSGS